MTEAQTFISGADGNEVFQAKYIPKQKGPPTADHPSLKAYISTYPPLGQQTTVLDHAKVFTALLEVDESRATEPWEVSLLYSNTGDQWEESLMESIDKTDSQPKDLQTVAPLGLHKLYFKTSLPAHLPANFTVKFRSNSNQSWKLIKDHQGVSDGRIVLKTITSQENISSNLSDYVQGLNTSLEVKNYRSQSPGTTLWSVQVPIEGAVGKESALKDIKFGLPWGQDKLARLVRLFVIIQCSVLC